MTAARSVTASAAGVLAALAVAWRFLTFSGFNNDHYVHVAGAQQLLLGEWPVRDFVDAGIPLMYAVHAAARALFGPALGVEWAVVAAGFAIGAACTVVAARRLSGSVLIAALVAVLEVAISPRSFGYPKVLLYAVAALAIMSLVASVSGRTLVVMALITVVAFLFRHDHGVFIGIAAVTAVGLASRAAGWRRALERAATFVGLVVLVLLPWLLFVQFYQGLGAYVASGIAASQGEAVGNALRELPRLRLDDLGSVRNSLTWLFYLFHALPVMSLTALVHRSDPDAWPGETAAVASLAVMAIPVNITFLRGNLDGRVPDAIVPAALLGSWLLGRALRRPVRVPLAVGATAFVAASAWAVVRSADVAGQLDKTELLRGPAFVRVRAADLWDRFQRRVPERDHVPSRYAAALMPFMDYVGRCTQKNDRLLVTGLAPEINVIADRGFAGGHLSFRPEFYTSGADQALAVARLERQSVPFVVSARQWSAELKTKMPGVFAYVERRFEPFVFVPVPDTAGVDLLIERHRPATRIDAATGWPCFR